MHCYHTKFTLNCNFSFLAFSFSSCHAHERAATDETGEGNARKLKRKLRKLEHTLIQSHQVSATWCELVNE